MIKQATNEYWWLVLSFACVILTIADDSKEKVWIMKKIMLGVSEFSKIRTMNGYYVDKSNLIEAVLEDGSEVVLFTRPRRFGKTLNMTMLRDFFDITKDTKSLFCGLNIEQSDYFEELNGYPMLFFSFRDCKGLKEALI